jgi:hypothetical protein
MREIDPEHKNSSVEDPGCSSWIPDLTFSILDHGSRIQGLQDPGSGSASKNFSIFNPKN